MSSTAGVKGILQAVAAGQTFSSDEMARAIELMTAEGTTAQKCAFLMGLRVRGETVDEIAGAARAMRAKMTTVPADSDAIDIVGTGGDGHGTFNVSTGSAIVAAGAGLKVAKHGNRSVSSLSGASDVLSALGVKLDCGPALIQKAIEDAGVGFLWAPAHHPAFKAWAEARAELGVRTMFNLMGPICNPANVRRHVIGVFSPEWVTPIAEVLRALGSERAWIVHGHDGLDELSTTGPTTVAALEGGKITTFEVTPEEAGLQRVSLAELKGGDGAHNARALKDLLGGARGPYRDIVLLNAAAALVVAGKAASLVEGVALAEDAINSGRAAAALDRLVSVSQQAA
ncbi:anthranilate phosphoribosyltransferase [Hyphomicrobium sp.]|uniref:anthranilate phosphoribosyltransferase n=1 Tax=Hyphomicrobium sp. TaxID=82 RepID=UPI002E35AAB7|nr:anthranilate phosphoribosyltransferase [Hyphomicrobium sp.]HEX2843021.1 anthranilate phosphoribosyltransferase [Hyphomicrobium sp.]